MSSRGGRSRGNGRNGAGGGRGTVMEGAGAGGPGATLQPGAQPNTRGGKLRHASQERRRDRGRTEARPAGGIALGYNSCYKPRIQVPKQYHRTKQL